MITGAYSNTLPLDETTVRPLRHRLPVRGLIPTILDARADGTPLAISAANASRFAVSGSGPGVGVA